MKRVVIGLSGGVDSSTSILLLQEQGYEVVGVTFKFIDSFDPTDAINVANMLDIEHHVLDYTIEFKEQVIDKFINDYRNGITPNPCVMCNKDVKLNFLYQEMLKLNCDYMATGHYAKLDNGKLCRSVDLNKDQTYFLCEVPKKILDKMIFPLEGIDKNKVRELANNAKLSVANKKDSTDVCFINEDFRNYLKDFIKPNIGDVVNVETNEVIGKHNGLSFYTIGQRRGLNIGGTDGRMFVVGKDSAKNILYVAIGTDNDYLISDECVIENANLISYHHPTFATAKFRYRSKEVPVSLEYLENDKIVVKYESGASGVTPGQACALYLGSECIGGGTITEVRKNGTKIWYIN